MILHATPDYRPSAGGIYYALRDLVDMERDLGLSARVWAATGDGKEPVVRTDEIGWSEVDVVHLTALWHPEHVCQWWTACRERRPHVLSPHGMFEPYILRRNYWTKKWPARWLFQDRIIREARWLHTTSEMERQNLLRFFPKADIRVIPNTVRPAELVAEPEDLAAFRKRYALDSGRRYFLYLSRFHPKKRILELLQWWAKTHRDFPDWTFLVVGEGAADAYTRRTQELARELERDGVVRLLPFLQGVDKAAAYRVSEAMVLPTESENFGNVVIEALWCGLPVLTTQGTPWEDLLRQRAGWWTPVEWSSVTDGIREMLTASSADLAILGRNGQEWVARTYLPEVVQEQWRALWEETGVS
jgi:glycosyltransferase involved in cell wall biosynthesis